MILTENEVRNYLSNAGFTGDDLNDAVKVCYCESGFDTNAHNLTSSEDSRGLMQINLKAHPYYSFLDMFNPQINCDVAYIIFTESGNNFSQWTCSNVLNGKNPTIFYGITLALFFSIYYFSK